MAVFPGPDVATINAQVSDGEAVHAAIQTLLAAYLVKREWESWQKLREADQLIGAAVQALKSAVYHNDDELPAVRPVL